MSESEPLQRPWGWYALEEGEERKVRLGPMSVELVRHGAEIWMKQRVPGRAVESVRRRHDRGEPEWSRWAVPDGTDRVLLTPVMPDRPVVVEPERTFHLVRGAEARVYVRVPLQVRIGIEAPSDITLAEIPTMVLSDTWFGDFTDGELCYALATTGRRRVTPDLFQPHLAVCSLHLVNRTVEQLEVKKLCLRVAHLSVFARNEELWSDETRVSFRSHVEGSDIRMSGKPPSLAPEATLVQLPREPLIQGLRARTFARLVGLPGMGSP